MINKKLLSFDPAAMRYVWRCVLCQWLSLLCNVLCVGAGWGLWAARWGPGWLLAHGPRRLLSA